MTSLAEIAGTGGQGTRLVSIGHRRLGSFNSSSSAAAEATSKSKLNSVFKFLPNYNHHALLVLDDPETANPKLTAFGLTTDAKSTLSLGSGDVDLKVEPNLDPTEYHELKFLVTQKLTGLTSLSNKQIEERGYPLIDKHGKYALLTNNCQLFADELFNDICNVKGNTGIKVKAASERFVKKNKKVLGALAVAGVAGVLLAELLD